jgi:Protein of unknown function (DUF3105)/Auxin canalisation
MAKTPKSGSSKRQRRRPRQQPASGPARPVGTPRQPAAGETGGADQASAAQPDAAKPKASGAGDAATTAGGAGGRPSGKPSQAQRRSEPRAIDRARAAGKARPGPAGKPVRGSAARRQAEQRRRRRTLLYTFLTVAVVAALVAVIVIDQRSDTPEAETEDFRQSQAALASARQAAGCTEVQEHPSAGRNHINPNEQPSNWNSNPPSSGDHLDRWLQPGFYPEQQDERLAVHSLEHGYVVVQYKNLPEDQVAQLRELQADHEGEKFVVQPYDGLESDGVALSAWQYTQTCEQVSLDVINGFIDAFMLPGGAQSKAPEPLAG